MDETELDKTAPATWLNGLSKVGKAAAEGWGKYTGAADRWSVLSRGAGGVRERR